MDKLRAWKKKHKFLLHTAAIFLTLLPPVGLYAAAAWQNRPVLWLLLGLVAAGNLLAIINE